MAETLKRLGVPISGAGSNLEAIIRSGLPVGVVIADRDCLGVKIAEACDIPVEMVYRTDYIGNDRFDNEQFTERVEHILLRRNIELVALAGFESILHKRIFDLFGGKMVNVHGSLLPHFKGRFPVRQALQAGVKVTGSTVHWVIADIDAGAYIDSREVRVLDGDNEMTLGTRIKRAEHEMYPKVLRQLMTR